MHLHFQSLEVASRYCDLQLQATENYLDLWDLGRKIIALKTLGHLPANYDNSCF